MNRISYYRRALWLPLASPVIALAFAFLLNWREPQQTGLVGLAAAFTFGLLAYLPFGLHLAYQTYYRHVSDQELRRMGILAPIRAGVLVAGLVAIAGALEGNFLIGGPTIVGLITMAGGYIYVLLIELIRAMGESKGKITS